MFNCFHELSQLSSFEFHEKSMNLYFIMLFIFFLSKRPHTQWNNTHNCSREWYGAGGFIYGHLILFFRTTAATMGQMRQKRVRCILELWNGEWRNRGMGLLSWFIKWSISCASYFYGFRCHTHESGASVKMKTLNELTTKMNSLNEISFVW